MYVPDADAAVANAVASGAKITMPLADQFWGDRSASIVDPFGHNWMVATHIEDPSPEEIGRRVTEAVRQRRALLIGPRRAARYGRRVRRRAQAASA